MSFRKSTYGINFPFRDSDNGDFLDLTTVPDQEIKSNLVHLLLTKKGTRYMMPSFGTNLHRFLFEPLDQITVGKIEDEIHDAVEQFIPQLKVEKIIIKKMGDEGFAASDANELHTIIITLDYTISQRTFETRDSITISF